MKTLTYFLVLLPVFFLTILFFSGEEGDAKLEQKDFSLNQNIPIRYVEEENLKNTLPNFKENSLLIIGNEKEPLKDPSVKPLVMYLNKEFIEKATGEEFSPGKNNMKIEKKFKDLDFWAKLGFSSYSVPIGMTMQDDSSNLINYLDNISKGKDKGLKVSVSFNSGGYPKFKCDFEPYK